MSFMLTRMFAYFTLFSYLVVGGMAVRLLVPDMTTVEVSESYLNLFQKYEVKTSATEDIVAPEYAFAEITIEEVKKTPVVVTVKAPPVKAAPVAQAKLEVIKVAKNELPFHEPVTLKKIFFENDLPKVSGLFVEFKYEMVAEAQLPEVSDEVKVTQAKNLEPEFFEYPQDEKKADVKAEVVQEVQTEKIEDLIVKNSEPAPAAKIAPEPSKTMDEVAIDDLIAFDYSKIKEEMKKETLPTVSKVTSQIAMPAEAPASTAPVKWEVAPKKKTKAKQKPVTTQSEENTLTKGLLPENEISGFPSQVTIHLSGTDFNQNRDESGFEIRFQDDLSATFQDYNTGAVTLDQNLAEPKMTRSMVVLKRGYAPTNTDLILEEGVSELMLPAIEEAKFNELLAPYGSRGPIGAVLVELEKGVEGASLDVPYSEVLTLDEDMKVTEEKEFMYQLFIGVKAGNSLLSYKSENGSVSSKIIHIHEHELTFESNFFEKKNQEVVTLLEEDLLAKEKTPLIIAADEVKEFATTKVSKKINNHAYKMNFSKTLLGGRRYLELTHQQESIFVGLKNNLSISVPSENFMRYVLSRFEGSRLGDRCLVQVNLSKKASKVDVAAESVGQSLVPYVQVLDRDGKFYESVGSKSHKIIIVGENQGAPGLSRDAKVNVKVTYVDGTVQYLGSYCSPNSYLVEQL